MIRSARRHSLVAAAGLALAGCVSVSPPSGSSADAHAPKPASADELLAAGDYDRATRSYRRDGADGAEASADEREKLETARRRAAVTHAQAAVRAANGGDIETARSELARADEFGTGVPAVTDAHAIVDARFDKARRAGALRDQARGLLGADPEEADRLLAEAQDLDPRLEGLAVLRREAALRAEADRSATRAAQAWEAQDRVRFVREIAGAQYGGTPVPKAEALRRRAENDVLRGVAQADEAASRAALEFALEAGLQPTVVRELRDRLVDKLVAGAKSLAATDRPATAALLEIEAKRLRGDIPTPTLDRVRETATVTVLVAPFRDETGGKVDGARVARALRERLNLDAMGGGLAMRALEDVPAARAAYPRALLLSGRVVATRGNEGRVGRETMNVPYAVGSREKENPAYDAVASRLADAVVATRKADAERTAATGELAAVKANQYATGSGKPSVPETEYKKLLAAAQARSDHASEALRTAEEEEASLRKQVETTPRRVDEPILEEHSLVVTTRSKTLQLAAHLELTQDGQSLLSTAVSAATRHKETVADAFAPAEIPEDKDETPDDATMAARAADAFASLAAGRVRAAAETAARRHLVDAREARKAGRPDAAAEGYAMFLIATPEVASPERADAARSISELARVHVVLRTGAEKERK